jgi:hypothetical protein
MGQFHEEIGWGILPWLGRTKSKFKFGYLTKKISFCALGESA